MSDKPATTDARQKAGTMNGPRALRAFAIASAIVTATALGTGPSSAASITNQGKVGSTYTEFVGCSGWVDAGFEEGSGTPYARGSFVLGTSTRDTQCKGWLERRESPSAPFVRISAVHTISDATAWYYDASPYQARVCVGDLLYSNSYSCVGFW
ncbi:hypothetical protein [Streptomyces sp. NPDC004284]|uniref:hypothetical protein n=1 Tax=Streptomyces sp. NPDC004284 TaxID=3364695 RepID=UPI0036BEE6DE